MDGETKAADSGGEVVIPYDPSILARLQKLEEERRRNTLTPEQRTAKESFLDKLERAETAVGLTAATDKQQTPDNGPVRPNLFRWPGCEEATLQTTPWLLVEYLWRQPERTAEILGTVEKVWGYDASDSAIRGAISKANTALVGQNIPVTLSQKNGYFSLSIDR